MFLNLNHRNLEVYKGSIQLLNACYKITQNFPSEERYNIIQQIRRAALSVILNIAEGASRSSVVERKRYYQVARGSLVEIDSALDVSANLNYLKEADLASVGILIVGCFSKLSKMIHTLSQ